MKEKIEEIVRNIASASAFLADVADIYEENYFKKEIDELSTLIQEERKEAVEGFVDSIKWKDTKEIDITDDLIDGRSLVNQVKEYLSSIGKDKIWK